MDRQLMARGLVIFVAYRKLGEAVVICSAQ